MLYGFWVKNLWILAFISSYFTEFWKINVPTRVQDEIKFKNLIYIPPPPISEISFFVGFNPHRIYLSFFFWRSHAYPWMYLSHFFSANPIIDPICRDETVKVQHIALPTLTAVNMTNGLLVKLRDFSICTSNKWYV